MSPPKDPEKLIIYKEERRKQALARGLGGRIEGVKVGQKLGHKYSAESIARRSLTRRGKSTKLKGQIIPVRRQRGMGRSSTNYFGWRKAVLERDNYTCQGCGIKQETCQCCGGSKNVVEPHHIKEWKSFPEFRFDVSNGLTLCRKCHRIEEARIKREERRLNNEIKPG